MKFNFKLFIFLILFYSIAFSQLKIVSLTPSITKSLYLLGEKENVVGITSFCEKISEKQIVVGTYLQPNIEEIIKLKPDIIFISKEGMRKEVVEELRKFGLKVVVFEPANTYNEIKQQFLQIAKLLNKEKIAKKVIHQYESKYKSYYVKTKKRVLCIVGLQPLVVASSKSFIGDIIKHAGAENCVDHSTLSYPQINPEQILRLNPDIIILPKMGISETEIKNFFNNFKGLSAVKNNKIFVLPSDMLCQPNIHNFFVSVEQISKLLK